MDEYFRSVEMQESLQRSLALDRISKIGESFA